jgi:hypothetical protein
LIIGSYFMPVKITCPHCRQALRLPDPLYDQPAQCPLCHGAFAVQWKFNPRAVEPAEPADVSEERRPCPQCGKPIVAGAVKCRWCHAWLNPP